MFKRICEGVYLVGGPEISDAKDCLVYAVDLGGLVLVDCGCGHGWPRIRDNISEAGLDPAGLKTLILTHCHVDHIGAVLPVMNETGCAVMAHDLDADAIESGDPKRTAAVWYGMKLPQIKGIRRILEARFALDYSGGTLELLHTPGHTPGSMSVVSKSGDLKVLFGQDVHGPFDPSFGSDIKAWRKSMEMLIALEADILCEGHYGVFKGKDKVRRFMEDQMKMTS